ncbi:MAG: hypothetical protein LBN04_06185 [Oscillospiraceae bacterium]|nr:hypothetical protein [Oscillospiraceae bacterium]
MKKHAKRALALWLALCLPLFAAGGAWAEAESASAPTLVDLAGSIAAGNEVYSVLEYEWKDSFNLLGLAEDELAMMSTLFDAMDIYSYSGVTEEGLQYESVNVQLNGELITYIDAVVNGEIVYVNSPILSAPVAVPFDQFEGLMNNLLAYLGVDLGEVMDPEMTAMVEAFATELMNWVAVLDIEGLTAAVTAWAEAAFVPEMVPGETESLLGATAVAGGVATVTPEEILALWQAIIPVLRANDALWMAIASSPMLPLLMEEAPATPEETIAAIDAALAEGLADMTAEEFEGLSLELGSYVDAEGNEAYGELSITLDGDAPFIVQWLPDMTGFALSYPAETDGFEVILTLSETEAGGEADLTFSTTSVVEGEKVYTGAIGINAALAAAPTDTGIVTDMNLTLSASIEGMDVGFELLAAVEDIYGEVYAAQTNDVAFNMLMMGQSMPILAASVESYTDDEPFGLPFHPDDLDFVYPGLMTPEAFAAWVDEDVTIGLMQALLNIIAHMPKEGLVGLMDEISF